MGLRVDITKCSDIGLCEVTAPTAYQIGDDGQIRVAHETPNVAKRTAVTEAIGGCPTGAFSIESDI